MKTLSVCLLLLGICVLVNAHDEGQRERERERERVRERVERLVDRALDDDEGDRARLPDIEVEYQRQSPDSPTRQERVRYYLRQGTLYGITSKTRRHGPSRITDEDEDRYTVEVQVQHDRMRVRYQQAERETQPRRQDEDETGRASGLESEGQDVRFRVTLRYDRQTEKVTVEAVEKQSSSQGSLRLQGAEEEQRRYPQLERELRRQGRVAVEQTLRQQYDRLIQKSRQQERQ